MKLIRESSFDLEAIREDTAGGKRMYIEGIYAQAEVVNGNRRWYPKSVLQESIDKYISGYVDRNRALGEINHPDYPIPNPDNAAIRITEMHWDGNNVMGKALVLKTDQGRKLQDLIEDGYEGGVSTRALGELKESSKIEGVNEVQPGLITTAVDYVADPSAPDAWPSAISESLSEWTMGTKGHWIRRKVEEKAQDAFEDIDSVTRDKMIIEAMQGFFNSIRVDV